MNGFDQPSFHDPHRPSFSSSFEPEEGSFSGDPFEDRPQMRFPPGRERKLFSSLMAQERYADIDKAKHNPHYLNYLMENFEDDF